MTTTRFDLGQCECGGGQLWRPGFKYESGFILTNKNLGTNGTVVYQWTCKACGALHHEPAVIVVHKS